MSLSNKDKRVIEVALANKDTAEKVVDILETPNSPGGNPEGTDVLSTGEASGLVLTADGNGGSSWEPSAGGGGTPEGTSILSTGEGAGKILTTDGQGASYWNDGPAPYAAGTFNLTFNQGVGLRSILYRVIGEKITLEIPAGSTADGGGSAIFTTNAIPPQFRPTADLSFAVIVTDNGVKTFGKLVITDTGIVTFSVGANNGFFTDNAAAGFDRTAISYSV